jgi:TPR repeat protein
MELRRGGWRKQPRSFDLNLQRPPVNTGGHIFARGAILSAMFLFCVLLIALQTAGVPVTQQSTAAPEQSALPHSSADIAQLQSKAEAGDAAAQLALGRAYQNGDGVRQNDDLAAKWYRKAADQGNAAAQNNLGVMYRAGLGVEKDKEEAMKWYHMAARQGDANAMFNIGAAYYDGDVRATALAAYEWFVLAEEAGSSSAPDAVKRTAAELGRPFTQDALVEIAQMYEKGIDLPQDYSRAIKWYNRAAESGSASAKVQLASMYLNGNGVPKDYSRAMELCRSAGILGYYCLGHVYLYGLGVPPDVKGASKWYHKGADAGNSASMLALGQMYWKGQGVELDRAESYYYFFLAYSHREKSAQQYAEQVAKEMTDDDTKRLNKKLKHDHLDPNKVQTFMHSDLPFEQHTRLRR